MDERDPYALPHDTDPPPPAYPPAPAIVPAPDASFGGTHVRCPNCGYNLTGALIGGSCPECGLLIGRGIFATQTLPSSGKAVAALVLGILSILGCMSYGLFSIICGPLAIIFAKQAQGQIRREEVAPASAGMATAGLVCGIIGSVMGAIALGFILLFFGGVFFGFGSFP